MYEIEIITSDTKEGLKNHVNAFCREEAAIARIWEPVSFTPFTGHAFWVMLRRKCN